MEPIILPRISDQKPSVSVVSITFNHEAYIRDCLEGFLMQKTDFPVEVIIHDDASTDHTPDIIREYYEKRPDLFHVILEKENQYSQGKYVSKPLFEQAQGKYIAFCEGDDYWTDPLKLQKQFDFMETHSDCSMFFHNAIKKSKDKEEIFSQDLENRCYSLSELAVKWIVPTASMFFMSSITKDIISIRQNNPGLVAGDILTYLTAAQKGKVYASNEIMSVYRIQPSGIHNAINKEPKYYYHFKKIQSIFDIQDPLYNIVLSNAAYAVATSQLKRFHLLKFLKFITISELYKKGQIRRFLHDIVKRINR